MWHVSVVWYQLCGADVTYICGVVPAVWCWCDMYLWCGTSCVVPMWHISVVWYQLCYADVSYVSVVWYQLCGADLTYICGVVPAVLCWCVVCICGVVPAVLCWPDIYLWCGTSCAVLMWHVSVVWYQLCGADVSTWVCSASSCKARWQVVQSADSQYSAACTSRHAHESKSSVLQ